MTDNKDFEDIEHWLKTLYEFGARRPGSPEGHLAEDYIFNEFNKIGLSEVRKQKIDLFNWHCQDWSIELLNGEKINSFYIPYTQFTKGKLEGELYHFNPGDRSDLTGKIAVVEISFPVLPGKPLKKIALDVYDPDNTIPDGDIHEATWIRQNWELYEKAQQQGALGFIGVLVNQPGGFDSYYAPYGFREGDKILDKPLPGFWVSKHLHEKMLSLCKAKEKVIINLKGECTPSESSNIIGLIPGELDENIIIGCHHDSPFKNAVEDSSGMAVLLSIAKAFIQKNKKPKRTLIFMATAGHFYGSIGTRKFIEENKNVLTETVAAIHIEHIALEVAEKEEKLTLTGQSEIAGIFCHYNKVCLNLVKNIIRKFDLKRTFVLGAYGPLGNYPPTDGGDFHLERIPIFNYISNPLYLLVDHDNLDMVDWGKLLPVRNAFISLIEDLNSFDKMTLRKENIFFKKWQSYLAMKIQEFKNKFKRG